MKKSIFLCLLTAFFVSCSSSKIEKNINDETLSCKFVNDYQFSVSCVENLHNLYIVLFKNYKNYLDCYIDDYLDCYIDDTFKDLYINDNGIKYYFLEADKKIIEKNGNKFIAVKYLAVDKNNKPFSLLGKNNFLIESERRFKFPSDVDINILSHSINLTCHYTDRNYKKKEIQYNFNEKDACFLNFSNLRLEKITRAQECKRDLALKIIKKKYKFNSDKDFILWLYRTNYWWHIEKDTIIACRGPIWYANKKDDDKLPYFFKDTLKRMERRNYENIVPLKNEVFYLPKSAFYRKVYDVDRSDSYITYLIDFPMSSKYCIYLSIPYELIDSFIISGSELSLRYPDWSDSRGYRGKVLMFKYIGMQTYRDGFAYKECPLFVVLDPNSSEYLEHYNSLMDIKDIEENPEKYQFLLEN